MEKLTVDTQFKVILKSRGAAESREGAKAHWTWGGAAVTIMRDSWAGVPLFLCISERGRLSLPPAGRAQQCQPLAAECHPGVLSRALQDHGTQWRMLTHRPQRGARWLQRLCASSLIRPQALTASLSLAAGEPREPQGEFLMWNRF